LNVGQETIYVALMLIMKIQVNLELILVKLGNTKFLPAWQQLFLGSQLGFASYVLQPDF